MAMRTFSREVTAERRREAVLTDAHQAVTVPLARHGYALDSQTDASLIYVCTYRPWYVILIAIVLFPIGLLALLHVERAYITITFEQDGGTTHMVMSGEGSKKVREAFETLSL
jgi:hypothetical protein